MGDATDMEYDTEKGPGVDAIVRDEEVPGRGYTVRQEGPGGDDKDTEE